MGVIEEVQDKLTDLELKLASADGYILTRVAEHEEPIVGRVRMLMSQNIYAEPSLEADIVMVTRAGLVFATTSHRGLWLKVVTAVGPAWLLSYAEKRSVIELVDWDIVAWEP